MNLWTFPTDLATSTLMEWLNTSVKNKLPKYWVTQHQCRRRQMCGKFSHINYYIHFLSVTKNDFSWLNILFMARFQLISMSSWAKNKLQMCSVTQHQCRRHLMWWKIVHKFTQFTHFLSVTKTTCPNWKIYSWQAFNSLVCPLMLKTNYRCVQSLNISVDVTRCVENVHKFTKFTHFLSVTKNDLS